MIIIIIIVVITIKNILCEIEFIKEMFLNDFYYNLAQIDLVNRKL